MASLRRPGAQVSRQQHGDLFWQRLPRRRRLYRFHRCHPPERSANLPAALSPAVGGVHLVWRAPGFQSRVDELGHWSARLETVFLLCSARFHRLCAARFRKGFAALFHRQYGSRRRNLRARNRSGSFGAHLSQSGSASRGHSRIKHALPPGPNLACPRLSSYLCFCQRRAVCLLRGHGVDSHRRVRGIPASQESSWAHFRVPGAGNHLRRNCHERLAGSVCLDGPQPPDLRCRLSLGCAVASGKSVACRPRVAAHACGRRSRASALARSLSGGADFAPRVLFGNSVSRQPRKRTHLSRARLPHAEFPACLRVPPLALRLRHRHRVPRDAVHGPNPEDQIPGRGRRKRLRQPDRRAWDSWSAPLDRLDSGPGTSLLESSKEVARHPMVSVGGCHHLVCLSAPLPVYLRRPCAIPKLRPQCLSLAARRHPLPAALHRPIRPECRDRTSCSRDALTCALRLCLPSWTAAMAQNAPLQSCSNASLATITVKFISTPSA